MNLARIKVGPRLGLGFGLVVVLMILIGALSVRSFEGLNSVIDKLVTDRHAKVVMAKEIQRHIGDQAAYLRNAILAGKQPQQVTQWVAKVDQDTTAVQQVFDKLEEMVSNPRAKELLANAKSLRTNYIQARGDLILLLQTGKVEEAAAYALSELLKPQADYVNAFEEFTKHQEQLMSQDAAVAAADVNQAVMLTVGLTSLAALLAVIAAVMVSRSIVRPLQRAVEATDRVAAGDLTGQITVEGNDELARLMEALRSMQYSLLNVISQVQQTSDSVASASAEIASGNQDLSGRTESQASALEQTAASMEELGSTVRQNRDSSNQANQLARSACLVAERGGEVVAEVVGTMKGINDSSKRIADIIGVIDGIAFQTNILALNAAVEAARAGEQGRGFAVVASEVRSLAGRSAEAAKEIKSLITASVERVEVGSSLVDKAGETMQEVVQSVRRVTDIMGEISAASQEQSSGVDQVGEAVMQMDQATQQNAALVEEMAAAASSLRSQSAELLQVVSAFKINAQARLVPAASVAASRPRPVPKPMKPTSALGASRPKPALKSAASSAPKTAPKAAPKPAVKAAAPSITHQAPKPAAAASGSDDDWETF